MFLRNVGSYQSHTQKMAFFIATAMKTSNLTKLNIYGDIQKARLSSLSLPHKYSLVDTVTYWRLLIIAASSSCSIYLQLKKVIEGKLSS
jgi:hypothetical protein